MKAFPIIAAALLLAVSCDVHEFPDTPATRPIRLELRYEPEMTLWNHLYDGSLVIEQDLGPTSAAFLEDGYIRYIVRTYPRSGGNRHIQEFVFMRNLSGGYDAGFDLDVIPGDYDVMVWSDFVRGEGGVHFYDAGNFAEIYLHGRHMGNTDYRDAFRGTGCVSIDSDIAEREADTVFIAMRRPLAKYEFITTDLLEFMNRESTDLQELTDEYKVVFHYAGFMPNAYNMYTDRPVDSVAGIMFESVPDVLNEHEASLGFDYVFTGDKVSAVPVQIGLYDRDDNQIALTDPIYVPLHRNRHTVIRGSFLMRQASGGLIINPEFEGNHNIIYELNSKVK